MLTIPPVSGVQRSMTNCKNRIALYDKDEKKCKKQKPSVALNSLVTTEVISIACNRIYFAAPSKYCDANVFYVNKFE